MSAQLAIAQPRRIKATHRRRRKVTAGRFVQRYYDPALGRMLSVDPMAVETTTALNFGRYDYALNNPYKFTDPDGRCPWCAVVGGVIGGGIEAYHQLKEGRFQPGRLAVETGKGALGGLLLGGVGGKLMTMALEGSISANTAAGGLAIAGGTVSAGLDSAGRAANGDPQSLSGSLKAGAVGALLTPLAAVASPGVANALGTSEQAAVRQMSTISNRGLAQGGIIPAISAPARAAVPAGPVVTETVVGTASAISEAKIKRSLE